MADYTNAQIDTLIAQVNARIDSLSPNVTKALTTANAANSRGTRLCNQLQGLNPPIPVSEWTA